MGARSMRPPGRARSHPGPRTPSDDYPVTVRPGRFAPGASHGGGMARGSPSPPGDRSYRATPGHRGAWRAQCRMRGTVGLGVTPRYTPAMGPVRGNGPRAPVGPASPVGRHPRRVVERGVTRRYTPGGVPSALSHPPWAASLTTGPGGCNAALHLRRGAPGHCPSPRGRHRRRPAPGACNAALQPRQGRGAAVPMVPPSALPTRAGLVGCNAALHPAPGGPVHPSGILARRGPGRAGARRGRAPPGV